MNTKPAGVPPRAALEAWAVEAPQPLEGGQGESFRAGALVLKPAGEPAQAVWLAEALDALNAGPSVRVVQPVRSVTGDWVVAGWMAWQWMEGDHAHGKWDEVLDASEHFHRAVSGIAWSPAIVASHRWAIADRVAWGEVDAQLPQPVQRLLARRRPVDLPRQLVHGDLGGNVLFHDSLPPGSHRRESLLAANGLCRCHRRGRCPRVAGRRRRSRRTIAPTPRRAVAPAGRSVPGRGRSPGGTGIPTRHRTARSLIALGTVERTILASVSDGSEGSGCRSPVATKPIDRYRSSAGVFPQVTHRPTSAPPVSSAHVITASRSERPTPRRLSLGVTHIETTSTSPSDPSSR